MDKKSIFVCIFLGICSSLFALTPIPVYFFSNSFMPSIEVEIEGQKYFLEVDSGSTGCITLRQEILNNIVDKKFDRTSKTFDIKGNAFFNSEFIVPLVKINGMNFEHVIIREENIEFLGRGCMVLESSNKEIKDPKIAGRIGWGILKRHQWYFDISNHLLWAADSLDELQREIGYFSVLDCVEVPFEMTEAGIILTIDTNIGRKRFILDTGANISCLRQSLVDPKHAKEFLPGKWMFWSKIIIGGVHFGHYPFFLYDFTPMLDVDGVMSIQFFERNGVYLNFQNMKAIIGPVKQPFWPRLITRICDFGRWIRYVVF